MYYQKVYDALGWQPSIAQDQAFRRYFKLLEKWNKAFNLVSPSTIAQASEVHLADCLAVLPFIKEGSLADVGAGAGLPGLLLAIARPEHPVTLIDSNSKKTRFMQQVVLELGLNSVYVHHGKASDFHPRAPFATVTCRAFSTLDTFIKEAGHLVAEDGELMAYKGVFPAEEMRTIKQSTCDFEVNSVHTLTPPKGHDARHLVVLKRKT